MWNKFLIWLGIRPEPIAEMIIIDEASDMTEEQWQTPTSSLQQKKPRQMSSRPRPKHQR